MESDHCIVTNFEGDIAIYRGQDLEELIREVANTELEDYPDELTGFEPTLENLEEILQDHATDLYYDAPRNY